MSDQREHNTAGRTEDVRITDKDGNKVLYRRYHCTCGQRMVMDRIG